MYTYIQLCLCRSIDRYDADPGVQGTFLLQMSNEITIHQKHLHALICKLFNSLNNSNPEFMWAYFTFKNITYNIRNGPLLKLPDAKST